MRSISSIVLLGSSLSFGLALGACTNNSSGTAEADSPLTAVDSADSTSDEGNVMMAAMDSSDQTSSSLTLEAVTAKVAANITARFSPPSCVAVTQTGTTVKAVYSDCTGVHGLVHVTGELDLAIALSLQGQISVHGTSSDLKVNGAVLTIDTTATYSSQGSEHELTVTTDGTGTGPRGDTVDHDGQYTLSWDGSTQCHSIMGEWSTELGSHTRSNTVNLSRCAAGCPTGSLVHAFLGGRTLDIEFDGTATASWTLSASAAGSGSAGAASSGTVQLGCQ